MSRKTRTKSGVFNIRIPCVFMLFVVLNLFWALWGEFGVSQLAYTASSMILVGWVMIHIITNMNTKYDTTMLIQFGATLLWCLAMIYAYTYGYHLKTVSFFGVQMDQHARIILYDAILLLPGMFFAEKYKIKFGKLIKFIVFAVVVSSLILTVIASIQHPNAMRERESLKNTAQASILFGLPDYSVIYGLSLLTPWFVWKADSSTGKKKLYYVIISASLSVMIAISQFATAFLALIVGIMAYFILKTGKNKLGSMLWLLVVISVVAIGRDGWAEIISGIAYSVEGSWSQKLFEIAEFVGGSRAGGDLQARLELYKQSFDVFLKSPLFGMLSGFSEDIGGHATLLDMLALVGVGGTVLFITMIYQSVARIYKRSHDREKRAALWAILIVYCIFFVMKNIIAAISINFAFFVLVPILFGSEEE